MSRRPQALVACALLATAAQSGCGIQERNAAAAVVVAAAGATLALPPHDAVLTSSVSPGQVNGRDLEDLVESCGCAIPRLDLPDAVVALDLRKEQAVVLPSRLPPGTPPTAPAPVTSDGGEPPPGLENAAGLVAESAESIPLAVAYSRWDLFVRPSAAEVATGSGVQGGTSTWLWFDVSALDPDRETTLATPSPVLLVSPHLLYMLLEGALTGSVERVGVEDVGGVRTTRYRFNIGFDKATKPLDDDDTQRVVRLFESADIDGTFFDDAEVWVDDDGVARRYRVTLPQRLDALTTFDLTYQLELTGPRRDPLPLPTNDDLAEVPTLPELLPGVGR